MLSSDQRARYNEQKRRHYYDCKADPDWVRQQRRKAKERYAAIKADPEKYAALLARHRELYRARQLKSKPATCGMCLWCVRDANRGAWRCHKYPPGITGFALTNPKGFACSEMVRRRDK